MKISKTFVIYALAVVILYLIYRLMSKSGYASGSKEITVGDVQVMLNAGMPEANIIVNLIKSGLTHDQAQQMVMNARAK